MFKHWGNGSIDLNASGNAHLYRLWKIPASSVDGWGAAGSISYFNSGYYLQFTWDGKQGFIKDWRSWSTYYNTNPWPPPPVPDFPSVGIYIRKWMEIYDNSYG